MKLKPLFVILLLLSATAGQAQSPGTGCACCSDEYRQFDFWVGDWVVYSQAEMIGFNKINKIEADCIIRENWKSVVSSHTGSSYNFYDKTDKKWKHLWMGSDGVAIVVKGNFRDGRMVMTGDEYRDDKNNRIINKMTWTPNPDGTVRQLWEQSKDGGQAFTVLFDGLYRKRK
jgi:hypothetical protein